jgi:hypothetical protein
MILPIGGSEVNANNQVNIQASTDKLQKAEVQ